MKTPSIHKHIAPRLIAPCLIALFALVIGMGGLTTPAARAADAKPATVEKKEATAARPLPFHGKLEAVDKSARSVKIGDGRTFQVMPGTRLTKDGVKPGTLDDAKVGDDIAGAYREGAGGKFELVSLRLGPKPEKKPATEKKK